MGWTNALVVGRIEPDAVECCDSPLVLRACVRLEVWVKETSDAERWPRSCIPKPERAWFSEMLLDKSKRPCSVSSLVDILRR